MRLLPVCIVERFARKIETSSRPINSPPKTSATTRSAAALSRTAIWTRSTRLSIDAYLLELRLGPGRLHHRRPVMHHHEPIVTHAFEYVGGQHLRFHGAVVAALGEIFLDHQHGEIAGHDDVDVADVEKHFKDSFENALPTFHHRTPTHQLA